MEFVDLLFEMVKNLAKPSKTGIINSKLGGKCFKFKNDQSATSYLVLAMAATTTRSALWVSKILIVW